MRGRIMLAALVWLAVHPAGWAEQPPAVPLVLGDAEAGVGVIAPGVGDAEAGVPTEPPPSVLVEDVAAAGDPLDPVLQDPVVSCIDGPSVWTAYATVDALFLDRPNTVGPLALENPAGPDPDAPAISAGDVRYPTIPGVRVFRGWRRSDGTGIEAGYLGAWSMHADAFAVSPAGYLALPGDLGQIDGSGFDAATRIEASSNATLNSAEVNVFETRVHDGCRRHDPLPWRRAWDLLDGTTLTADWIFGIRWAGIDETATLTTTVLSPAPPPEYRATAYRVTTSSQLVGPQVGHRRRVDWGDWSVEGWAKVGLMGSALTQSQSAVVGPYDLLQVRPPSSSTRVGVGMIGDLNAAVVRRLGDHWGLRAGYTLLWFSGVAPAMTQWDFTNTTTSGTEIVPGTVFLHGATLGLEAAW